jgi:hypothetical protein
MGIQANDNGLREASRIARPLAGGAALFAIPFRLLPYLPNASALGALVHSLPFVWHFWPLGGLGLYSGGRLRSWEAVSVTLAPLAISNMLLALVFGKEYFFYPTAPFVVGSLLLNVLIGRVFCRTRSPLRIGTASLLASVQFFLVTNFGQWLVMGVDPTVTVVLQPGEYARTLAGLGLCYLEGIPFFLKGTLPGDLLYTAGLFGLHAWLARVSVPAARSRAVVLERNQSS